jgi:hypothetical protein
MLDSKCDCAHENSGIPGSEAQLEINELTEAAESKEEDYD